MDLRRLKRKESEPDPDLGRLLLRLSVGGFFIGHGTQKLFGWFGGHGPDGTGQFFESIGLRPGRRHALTAGTAETAGGALLAAGLATPLAATSLISVMLTAIRKVHAKKGPWVSEGGYEYNVVLVAAALALAELGPGEWSLDAALGIQKKGIKIALATLGAGALGSLLATRTRGDESKPVHAEQHEPAAADLPTTAEARETETTPAHDPAAAHAQG